MKNFDQSFELIIEKLSTIIKDYAGYSTPTVLGKTDQNLRNFLKEKLHAIWQQFPEIIKINQSSADSKIKDNYARVISGIELLLNSLENPCHADKTFFKNINEQPDILLQIYNFDQQLVEQTEIMSDELAQLSNGFDQNELGEILYHFYDQTDGINQLLTEREFLFVNQ
jgi:hypothetical protein